MTFIILEAFKTERHRFRAGDECPEDAELTPFTVADLLAAGKISVSPAALPAGPAMAAEPAAQKPIALPSEAMPLNAAASPEPAQAAAPAAAT